MHRLYGRDATKLNTGSDITVATIKTGSIWMFAYIRLAAQVLGYTYSVVVR